MKIMTLFAKMMVGAFAAGTVVVGFADGTRAVAAPGEDIAADGVITIAEVRESTTGELILAMKKLSGARDAHLAGGQKGLLAAMEAHGYDVVPLPAVVPDDPDSVPGPDASYDDQAEAPPYPVASGLTPSAAPITYRKGNSSSPSTLHVCRNWVPSGGGCYAGHGYLGDGANSQSASGWSDTDGYYNASYMKTPACAGGVWCYSFPNTGWIKTGGLAGGTWMVSGWYR